MTHPRGRDRQQPTTPPDPRYVQPKVEPQLPGRRPLPGSGLQALYFDLVIRRSEVPDLRRPLPSDTPSALPSRPTSYSVRRYGTSPRDTISAQIRLRKLGNQQVNAMDSHEPAIMSQLRPKSTRASSSRVSTPPDTGVTD